MVNEKEKLLLHSCCGPCSTAVIERLIDEYDVTIYFYNPNITDEEEYLKRLETQKKFIHAFNLQFQPENKQVGLIEAKYDPEAYLEQVRGLENEKEGGTRCTNCFILRMRETAEAAKKNGFDLFCTTLTVSPHKDAKRINEIGEEMSASCGIKYLYSDFKKKDGYRRSVEMSKKYELYRQNYCGCEFSKWWKHEIR